MVHQGLVTNYGEGGYKTGGRGGGHVKFYHYEKEGLGGGKSFSHAEGMGGTTGFEVVFKWKLEVLAILKGGGGAKSFYSLKEGGGGGFPCLEVGAQKVSVPRFSHFVDPPPCN